MCSASAFHSVLSSFSWRRGDFTTCQRQRRTPVRRMLVVVVSWCYNF